METLIFLTTSLSLFTPGAYAYIDPGSGSYFLQIILAGLLSLPIIIKMNWQKIRNFTLKQNSQKPKPQKDE